ncbi:class II histone deacetylase complex subunits 2 and 3-domain-containing protein [Aspergillus varians]
MRSKREALSVFTDSSFYDRRARRRHHYIDTSSDEDNISADDIQDDTEEQEWEINGILDETESQYLFDWVGPWSPTWEPKEYASEVAIQIWEEKQKKKEQPASERTGSSVEPSPAHSHNSLHDKRAEAPEQEAELQRSSNSPLFVPLGAVSEVQFQEIDQLPPPTLAIKTTSESHTDPKPSRENRCQDVFEYYPRAPIPPEYRLPGEFEEPPTSTTTQHADSAGIAFARDTQSQNQTEGISEHLGTSRRRQTTVQPSPRAEIPETPPLPFFLTQSQFQQTGPRLGTFDSQQLANPIGFLSNTISPVSLTNRDISAGNLSPAFDNTNPNPRLVHSAAKQTTSAPESARGNSSQPLRSRPLIAPTAQTSGNLIGLSPITLASQTSLLRRLPSSGNLPITPQRIAAHTVASAAKTHPAAPHPSAEPATMDDQSPSKGGGSLAQAMEKYSHIEGSTPREKIMNAHAKFREKSTFETFQNDPSATPSSVGDVEASEPLSIPETVAPLSVRVDKDFSHAVSSRETVPETSLGAEPQTYEPEAIQTIQPSALTISHTEQKPPGSLHLGPSEFAVPLPMDSRVKDDYERVLLTESEGALGLAESQEISESEQERIVSTIQQVLERLSNAATHPDINVAQHMKHAESKLEQEAAWADYSSAKFLLLNYLIKAVGDHDIHLVIMVRGEKTQRVVERYLNGKGFEYTRPRGEMGSGTNVEVSMSKAALSFGIQAAQGDGIVETYKPPLALIALDSSLNTKNPSVEHMRTTFARNGHLLPVIRLMVASSSEHVELCFPGSPKPEHLSLILRYSLRLRDIVGDLQDDALGVHEDANEIATCLLSDNVNAFWSLPPVEPLREVNLAEPVPVQGISQPDVGKPKPSDSLAQKRLFVEEPIEATSKRPRMDESQDTSQFTVSSKGALQTLDSQIQSLEKNLMEMRGINAAELEKLQKALAASESRLHEKEKILGSLQHRYESRTKDLHNIRQERDRLLETKATSEQKLEKQKDEITKLKDERTQLRHELEQARESLKNGGGDMAELEKAREETRRLTKENAGLVRKADVANKQAEYTREQYQTASNVAAQSANEIRQLKEENEALKCKSTGEAVRLREINLKNDESRHLARVLELESLLSSREDMLHKKEDELREIRKNRPSTRSTSTQPRSPKLSAGNHSRPTSPGINNNNNNNGNGSNFPGRGSALRFSSEMSL